MTELPHAERFSTPLDDAILDLLTGAGGLTVYDVAAPADEQAKVITAALPYVVFTSATPVDGPVVYTGDTTARELEFQLMYVGQDRRQAKRVGERAEGRIHKRIPLPGAGPIGKVESLQVTREETYTGPGGIRLFYGVDTYAVTY